MVGKDDTKTRIIEAAGPIFADQGYRKATIREICEAAGVGLASVNYHFRDKQHLYVRVVETALDYVKEHRPPPLDTLPDTTVDARLGEWILRLARKVMVTQRESWQERLVAREFHDPNPGCETLLRQRLREDLQPLFVILGEVLPPDTPRHDLWRTAFSIVGQCLFYDTYRALIRLLVTEETESTAYQAEQVAQHIARVSLAALGLGKPLASADFGGPS